MPFSFTKKANPPSPAEVLSVNVEVNVVRLIARALGIAAAVSAVFALYWLLVAVGFLPAWRIGALSSPLPPEVEPVAVYTNAASFLALAALMLAVQLYLTRK